MGLLLSVNEGCRHPVKRIAAAVLSTTVLGLSTASAAGEKSFFRSPPTDVAIHNPASTENQRNRTTISVRVPDNAGNALQQVVLTQISAEDPWDWGDSNRSSISVTTDCVRRETMDSPKPGCRIGAVN